MRGPAFESSLETPVYILNLCIIYVLITKKNNKNIKGAA